MLLKCKILLRYDINFAEKTKQFINRVEDRSLRISKFHDLLILNWVKTTVLIPYLGRAQATETEANVSVPVIFTSLKIALGLATVTDTKPNSQKIED